MTSYSTKTREFGPVTFSAPAATDTYSGYVWIDGPAFKDRRQICHGGDFKGSTVQSTSDEIKAAAQRWMRARARWRRAEGLML